MSLSKEEVLHIAKLARLSLSEADLEKYRQDLSAILEYVEMLKEVDVEGVEITAQTTGLDTVLREDIERQRADADKLLECSPHPVSDRMPQVKKIR